MNELVENSLFQYRQMLAAMELLEAALGKDDPDVLLRLQAHMAGLQDEIEETDVSLNRLLEAGKDSSLDHLLEERLAIMDEIVRRNRLLLPRVEAMMACTLAELNEIRTGMVAVAGYRPGAGEKGRKVRGAC